MAEVEEELWNIFTFYTLRGNPLDLTRLSVRNEFRICERLPILCEVYLFVRAGIHPIDSMEVVLQYGEFLEVPYTRAQTRDMYHRYKLLHPLKQQSGRPVCGKYSFCARLDYVVRLRSCHNYLLSRAGGLPDATGERMFVSKEVMGATPSCIEGDTALRARYYEVRIDAQDSNTAGVVHLFDSYNDNVLLCGRSYCNTGTTAPFLEPTRSTRVYIDCSLIYPPLP